MIFQLGEVYLALAGMQQALGQGARYATLCVNPTTAGDCGAPDATEIQQKMEDSTFGTGVGHFWADLPKDGTDGVGKYYDLTVHYTQPTSLLLFPGPTITFSRTKRVWTAAAG
jgi:hypothetical protein